MSTDRKALRFVRLLLGGGGAGRTAAGYLVKAASGTATLTAERVSELAAAGVLETDATGCRAAPAARSWVRRELSDAADPFGAQHRHEIGLSDGARLNLAESPLARLATTTGDGTEPFLAQHQVEAGERVRRLTEQAQLRPRVTMSYSATHTAGGTGVGQATDITDLAAEARRRLAELHRVLPRDCAGVVLDVCGLQKGLQLIESERGWPRRSAKLVLRIGLDQLARHYGLAPEAVGTVSRRPHRWLDAGARPERFEAD